MRRNTRQAVLTAAAWIDGCEQSRVDLALKAFVLGRRSAYRAGTCYDLV